MDWVVHRLFGRLWLILAGLLLGAVMAGSGAAAVASHTAAASRSLRYSDRQGWWFHYPSSLSSEHSTSGPGMATFTEATAANFAQRRAVVTGRTHDGGFIVVRPPLDRAGRFPAGGVAFRMLLVDGPPRIGTVTDSRFPIELSTFARSRPRDFPRADYKTLGVPRELARSIDADGQHYEAMVLIGPAASASERAAIEAVIASLTFPRPPPGAFYALRWTSEDVHGGYRSACQLRFDRRDEQFYCTNSLARWGRTGPPIHVPRGARFSDGLQFAFAKVAWDGHVVFLPGLGGNPPRAKAHARLWPRRG